MSRGLITTLVIVGVIIVFVGGFFMWGTGVYDTDDGIHSDSLNIKVTLNNNLKNRLTEEEAMVIGIWEKYLNTRDTFYYMDSHLWSYQEKLTHKLPDFEIHSICYRTRKFSEYKPSILSIQKIDSAYILKTLFARSDTNGVDILAIYNVVAAKESHGFVFHRYSEFFKKEWKVSSLKTITFYYDSGHSFNESLAKRSDAFNIEIAEKFKAEPLDLRYYLYKNTEERLRAKGYDYDVNMFETIQTSAEVDLYNNIIYASNGTEFYPHEIVHFYTNAKYGSTIHIFFDEGIATLLGGNINTYREDLLTLKKFTNDNPLFDFGNLAHLKKSIGSTNCRYTVGALLCQLILEQGGWESLEYAFKSGKNDHDLYTAIEKTLGVPKEDINRYVREQINSSSLTPRHF